MNKNDKKSKTILSRSLTEKGEIRIIVPIESGSSCEYKITEKDGSAGKALHQYTHVITAVTQATERSNTDTGTHMILLHTHLCDPEKIFPSLRNSSDSFNNMRSYVERNYGRVYH